MIWRGGSWLARRTGFYCAVTHEGKVGAGDKVTPLGQDPNAVPMPWITRLYVTKRYINEDIATLERVLSVPALPDSWKNYFRKRVERANA